MHGFSLSSPTVTEYIQHLSHFSPSATTTSTLNSVASFISTPDTINTSCNNSSLSFKNSYVSLSAFIITLAFKECPITFSALATSNAFDASSFIFIILFHFSSNSLFSYSSFVFGQNSNIILSEFSFSLCGIYFHISSAVKHVIGAINLTNALNISYIVN